MNAINTARMTEKKDIKTNIEILLKECFKKAAENKFKQLNFVFPKDKEEKQFFKTKLETLNKLDEYSQTFLSIHTRAKLALREFQQSKFDGQYLELLKSVLTLPENIRNKKSISISQKSELDEMRLGPEITITESRIIKPPLSKTKLIKPGTTGKSISGKQKKLKQAIDNVLNIEFINHKNPIDDLTI